MGVLGCRVCGCLHICDALTCKDVTATNDGRVCGISGVVIYDRAYSDVEFLDTLVLTDSMPVCNEFAAEMTNTVKMMLSSAFTLRIRRTQLCQNMLHFGHELHASSNFVLSCMAFAKTAELYPYLFHFTTHERREQLVRSAEEDCGRAMHLMISNGMSIRPNDVQKITIGLLYLMRCGVTVNNDVVLPRRMDIRNVLPPENILYKNYGIHPKFITETENRLKFSIRSKLKTVDKV
jgi:hypothetical protein